MPNINTVYLIFGRTLHKGVYHGHGESWDEWREFPACGLAFASQGVAGEYMAANRSNPTNAPLAKADEYAIIPFQIQV